MAATAVNHTTNGPSTSMYTLKPYQAIGVIEIPKIMYRTKPYCDGNLRPSVGLSSTVAKGSGSSGPGGSLEQRQEDVLQRLEEMQATVSQLALRYKVEHTVSALTTSTSSSATTGDASLSKFVGEPGRILDLVISADPSSVPLSLVVLCERLSQQYPTILGTFLHSSVASVKVSDRLQNLLRSNGSRSRADCQIAVTFVWKKVSHGPQLVVDPVHQTTILGEANIARYLWALLANGPNPDPVGATQEDELIDLAQLQVFEGNNKERAAALRQLNSLLGKQRSWLVMGEGPSLCDIVCWSALQQTGLAQGCPANVQRWVASCGKHGDFATALGLLEVVNS